MATTRGGGGLFITNELKEENFKKCSSQKQMSKETDTFVEESAGNLDSGLPKTCSTRFGQGAVIRVIILI